MPFIDSSSRVGRSQGASIFWGLVSVFFAAAACFYFWKSHENESSATKLRDEVLHLQDENDKLNAEKDKLQASMSDSAGQLKTREEFLEEKEAKLAAEETRLEALAQKSSSQNQTPATPKKFSDAVHKLSQLDGNDSVTRGGRQVLRVSNATFFAPADATLKPEGQALLSQIVQTLNGADTYELRIESYTDSDAEVAAPDNAKAPGAKKDAKTPSPAEASKSAYANSWDLTAARAVAIERYFREQGSMPFQNVLVIPRGDALPIISVGKDSHARNRRTEISVAPLPSARSSDASKSPAAAAPDNSLAPPPEPSPAAKDKDKDKAKTDKSDKSDKSDKADKPEKTDKSSDKADKTADKAK